MNKRLITIFALALSLFVLPAFSQTESQSETDTTLLGLPGDNLDLFAVLDLFQQSPTIEDFEKSLNLEETGVNNLDLDLDEDVDFIKVVTKQDGDDFSFILQVDISETEVQDVAVIFVSKDENQKVFMQIVGDKDLYGENYIVEPAPGVTPNPGYAGDDNYDYVTTPTVVVESTPIVQYVYSPVYVPYYPPYYYAYYPPYYAPYRAIRISVYHNRYYHHRPPGYHGGRPGYPGHPTHRPPHGNNPPPRPPSTKPPSNGGSGSNRPSTSPSTRPSTGGGTQAKPSTRPSTGTSPSTRPSNNASPSTRPSTGASPSTRPSNNASPSTRPSNSAPSQQYRSNSNGASRYSGSGRSSGGGGSRGGGGRRR